MQRMIKTFLCVAMLTVGWQQAQGFALLGPLPGTVGGVTVNPGLPANFGDVWQVDTLGYAAGYFDGILPGDPVWLGDLGGPKNIGEGYRRNDPVVYYAYDQNFSDFYGVQGEAAGDQAFAIMNNFFTNHPTGVDGYSANLTEFPFDSQHFNGTAVGLYLTDLKSVTLHLLVEQMGLTEPERYTWALEDRFLPPGGKCPFDEEYLVVQRNFATTDQPLTGPETGTLYSPYVNDILYTYGISEVCTIPAGSTFKWLAVTEPFAVQNPGLPQYTAVAANDDDSLENLGPGGGLENGGFYTGLTEDDAAGLRYLMTSNNIVDEIPAAGTELEATNFGTLNLLITSNVTTLALFTQTNPPATVQAAFPDLEISSVTNYFTVGSNPIVVAYFTNLNGAPAGTPPFLVVVTNGWTFFPVEDFSYTFGNIVYVHYYSNTVEQLQTVTLQQVVGAPVGTPPVTNVTYQTVILTNVPSGDYYVIPPGTCGLDIVANLLTNNFASATTNVIFAATNTTGTPTGFVGSESIVTYFTNDWFEYYGCAFATPTPAEYQGIEKLQFERVADSDVDPLSDTFYIPVTNTYTMVWWNPTNAQLATQTFQRIVTQPDFLFTASPNASGPGGLPFVGTVVRNIRYETGQILPGLSGPGVIDGQTVFNFNDIGTIWWNGDFPNTNSYLPGNLSPVNQSTGASGFPIPGLLWASFDETTNQPIVYPNNLSIQEMENQMVITISPSSLPNGTNGVPYATTSFSATGGTPPYSWSLASGSQLPSGLALFGGVLEGEPNGNTNGVYDVTIQLNDSSLPVKTVTMNYTITIN
jgi:hypothetical protein